MQHPPRIAFSRLLLESHVHLSLQTNTSSHNKREKRQIIPNLHERYAAYGLQDPPVENTPSRPPFSKYEGQETNNEKGQTPLGDSDQDNRGRIRCLLAEAEQHVTRAW